MISRFVDNLTRLTCILLHVVALAVLMVKIGLTLVFKFVVMGFQFINILVIAGLNAILLLFDYVIMGLVKLSNHFVVGYKSDGSIFKDDN